MRTCSSWFWLILPFALSACKREAPPPPPASVQHPQPPSRELVAYPAQKPDTIMVEGEPQMVMLKLIQPKSSVPFLTYMPPDMIEETRTTSQGEGHYFIANFAGQRNDNAYLVVFVYPAGVKQEEAVRIAKEFQSVREKTGYVVNVDLRLHNNRYYYIGRYYPAEYGDGFGPRAKTILDEWQWLDAT